MLGLFLGALIGWAMGAHAVANLPVVTGAKTAGGSVAASPVYLFLKLLADLFLNSLKLIVVPLVVSAVILAVAGLRSGTGLGRLGLKSVSCYLATSLVAILIGLVLVHSFKPGVDSHGQGILAGRDLFNFHDAQAEMASRLAGGTASPLLDVFRKMVPDNLFAAAVNEQLLGLLVIAILIGFFLARLGSDPARVVVQFAQGVYDVTMKITSLVLALAPIGVLALMAVGVAEQYARLVPEQRFGSAVTGILLFSGVVVGGLFIHTFGALFVMLRFVAGVKPARHFKAMLPAFSTAFATASSNAALPVAMECAELRAGISRTTSSFVLSLGAALHRDGSALYQCIAVIFICQCVGIDLSVGQELLIVLLSLITSLSVSGIPGASLVPVAVILQTTLPEQAPVLPALALLMVIDRPLDMCRSAVNSYSHACAAAVVARTEGEPLALVS